MIPPKLQWVTCKKGEVPINAIIASVDNQGKLVLVVRVRTEWGTEQWNKRGISSSKFIQGCDGPTFIWNGDLTSLEEYQVLTAPDAGGYSWTPDEKGYVPVGGAAIGGLSTGREYVYIGRVEIEGSILVGTILPTRKTCAVAVNGGIKEFDSYQVLVKTSYRACSEEGGTGSSSKGAEVIVDELKDLQRSCFHKNWDLYTDETTPPGEPVHQFFLSLLSLSDVQVLHGKEPDWIPYVGRLARLYKFPPAFQAFLFKLIETCAADTFSKRTTQRLACILKYAAKAEEKPNDWHENAHTFGPILAYLAQPTCPLDEIAMIEIIHTILFTLEHQNVSVNDIEQDRELFIPSSWTPLLDECFRKLDPQQSLELIRRFKALGIFSTSATNPLDDASTRLAEHRALAKLKLKSLINPSPLGHLAFTANVVHVQELRVQDPTTTGSLSERLVIPTFNLARNFDELFANGKTGVQKQSVDEVFEKALTDTSATAVTCIALCRSVIASQLPLSSEKLHLLIAKARDGNGDLKEAIAWTLLASLSKDQRADSELEEEVKTEFANFIIQFARACTSPVTLEAIFATLYESCVSWKYSEENLSHVKEMLEKFAGVVSTTAGLSSDRILERILQFLCNLRNPVAFDTGMLETIWSILQKTNNSAIRVLCTQHISIACSEHKQPLESNVLSCLAHLTEDAVRDVRVYSRVAFSNGLLNNPRLHSDQEMIALIAKVFVIHPVQLTTPGNLPAEFTEKINGPLLTLIEKLAKIPPSIVNSFCKFIGNLATQEGRFSQVLRPMVHEVVKILMKALGKIKLLAGTVESVEKYFLAHTTSSAVETHEESDRTLLTCVAKCIELKLISTKYIGSDAFLQKITAHMDLYKHPTYAIILHMFTTIQEIPDRIFQRYHFQLAALRLSSILEPSDENNMLNKFMSDHALDKADEKELFDSICRYVERGVRPSALTIHILVQSIRSTKYMLDVIGSFKTLLSFSGYLKETEMEALLKLHAHGKHIWAHLAFYCMLTGQNLSQALIKQILDQIEEKESGEVAVKSVSLLLCNPVASLSENIVQQAIRIAVKNMRKTARRLKELESLGEASWSEESKYMEALKLLLQALTCVQESATQPLPAKLAKTIKRVLLKTKKLDPSEIEVTDTDLLLQLLAVSPETFAIDEINQVLDNEGPALIFSKSNKMLQKLYAKLLEIVGNQSDGAHVLFSILGVYFGNTDDIVISSACQYIKNHGGTKNSSRVPVETPFLLRLGFTSKLQNILRNRSGDYASQIIQAINDASDEHNDGFRYLDDFSSAVFSAWLYATSLKAKFNNELILLALYKKGHWKVDGKTKEALNLVMFAEGSSQLQRVHFAADGDDETATEAAVNTTRSALDDADVVPFDSIAEFMTQVFIKCGIGDVQTQALTLGETIELYKYLRSCKMHNQWEAIVWTVMIPDGASLPTVIALLTQAPGYSVLKTLNGFLAQLNPSVLNRILSLAKPQDTIRHAVLWKIARVLHDKLALKCEFHRIPSIFLSSKLLEACGNRTNEVLKLLNSLDQIENHMEVEDLIEMLTACKQATSRSYPDWCCSQEFDNVCTAKGMSLAMLKIKLTTGFVLSRFFPRFGQADATTRVARDLNELLQRGVCNYKHFLKLGSSSSAFLFKSLALLFRIFRNYGVEQLPEGFCCTESDLLDFGENLQRMLLPSLLWPKAFVQGAARNNRSATELVQIYCKQNGLPSTATHIEKLVATIRRVQGNVPTFTESDIQQWSASVRSQNIVEKDPVGFFARIQRALQLLRGWTLTPVQILSIYVAITEKGKLFQQVPTGLGKSLIIAVIAVKKALEGHPVDIFTSNSHLASRDSNEWSEFFALFGLRCDHNGEEEDGTAYRGGEKSCYGPHIHIVYGDIRQFEFDALRNDYLGLGTRGERAYGFAIVDEVDSCFLDDANKLTILSCPIAGMELLQPLYHRSWKYLGKLNAAINLLQVDSSYFTFQGRFVCKAGRQFYVSPSSSSGIIVSDDDIKAAVRDGQVETLSTWEIYERRPYIKDFLKKYIQSLITGCSDRTQLPICEDIPAERIKIPSNLKEFATSQTVHWAEAAIVAHTLQEEKDYVIVNGTVAPLDPSNGATQLKSSWSNGVQQFLQIKHCLKFTPETLMTAFMSHRAMLAKYEDRLFGITGTLGNAATKEFLSSLEIKTLQIPDRFDNSLRVFPDVDVATNKNDWMLKIKEAIEHEVKNARAVLVICKTIRSAQNLREYLPKMIPELSIVYLYARSDDDEVAEEDCRSIQAQPRGVYITTLLGSRGMDIRPIRRQQDGGIHVILTFLLPNGRAEKQAFGRTARQGSFGSVQYIIKRPRQGSAVDTTYKSLSSRIDAAEDEQLKILSSQIYPAICAKDEAFEEYRKCFTFLHQRFLSNVQESGKIAKVRGKVYESALSEYDISLLQAYQEYWAVHFALKSKLFPLLDTCSSSSMDRMKMALKDFKRPMKDANAELGFNYRNPQEVFELTRSCFHPTRYAFQLYNDNKFLPFAEKIPQAKRCFELALNYDPEFAAGASLGLSYISLLGDKKYYVIPENTPRYKDDAVRNLTNCLAIFSEEVCQLQGLLNYVEQEGNDNPLPSEYEQQLRIRLQILQHYGAVVYKTLDFVKLSFRSVYVRQANPEMLTETRIQIPVGISKLSSTLPQNNARVSLECEGLNWKKDFISYHQCESAIKFLQEQTAAGPKHEGLEGRTDIFTVKMKLKAENVAKFFEYLVHDGMISMDLPTRKNCKENFLILDVEFRIKDWIRVIDAIDVCKTEPSPLLYSLRVTQFSQDSSAAIKNKFEGLEGEDVQLWSCRQQICDMEGRQIELEPGLEEPEVRGRIKYTRLKLFLEATAVVAPNANVIIEMIHIQANTKLSLLNGVQQVSIHVAVTGALDLLKLFNKADINPHSIEFTNMPIEVAENTVKHLKWSEDPITQVAFKPFASLFLNYQSPTDVIHEMKQRGLHWVAVFEELDSSRPATAGILAFQFVVELAAGALLTATGMGGIFAQPLYAAAVYDICTLVKGHFLRKFSWTTYCLCKPLGLAFSFGLAGMEFLASDGTPSKPFLHHMQEIFSSPNMLMGALGYLLTDTLPSFVAFLAGPLADYVYKQERSRISEKVREAVSKYLGNEPEMQHLLASFCALERLHHGNELLSISSASELKFRLWLKSAGLGLTKSWKSKLLKAAELWLTQQGIKNPETFKGLTVAGVLLHSAKLIWNRVNVEKITDEACVEIQKKLIRNLSTMQDLSGVLVDHCGLSQEQVSKLRIKQGVSCFLEEMYLPNNAEGLYFITDKELLHVKQRLKRLRELKATLVSADRSILLASLSDFVTDHIVGYVAKALIACAMEEPRRRKTMGTLSETEELHCVIIENEETPEEPVPTVSNCSDEGHQENEDVLKNLMDFCASAAGPFYDPSQLPLPVKPAAIQLAKAMLYSFNKGLQISVVEDRSDSCPVPPGLSSSTHAGHVLLFQLNAERTQVISARLKDQETKSGMDCVLQALGKRSGSVMVENSLALYRLSWLTHHLLSVAPPETNELDDGQGFVEM